MRRLYLVTPRGVVPFVWDPRHGVIPPRVPFAFDAVGRPVTPAELAGLGSFLKKVGDTIHKAVTAPIRAISSDLVKPLDKLHETANKVADKITTQVNNDLHKIGKWAKKNWKWIVIAAAIVLTIYTMGGAAPLVAKLQAAWQTVSTYVANHAVSLSIKAATTVLSIAAKQKAQAEAMAQQQEQQQTTLSLALGMQAMERLLAGAKIGDLSPEEVEAVATLNDRMGMKLVPDELLKYFVHVPGGASAIEAVQNGEMDLDPVDTAQTSQVQATQAAAQAAGAAPVPRSVVQGQTQLRVATSQQNAAAYAASLAQSAALEADQQARAQASIASWAAVRAGQDDPSALYAAGGGYEAGGGYAAGGSYEATPAPYQPMVASAAPPSWLLPVGIAAAGLAVAFLVDR